MATLSRALLALLLLAGLAHAAPPDVPGVLTYQGVLLDDQGQPRTGNVSLTLRIYDALVGGTLVYKQELPTVGLFDGVFTVLLGPVGSATDDPTDPLTTDLSDALAGDAGATAPARFLEVTVGSDGPLLRSPLLSVPYALRAGSAESADQATMAQFAESASDTASVGGLSSDFVTQLFEHSNLDGVGPGNSDPSEGLGDTDLDGVANFLDPDNDDDGLNDSVEENQGSDINLVTPLVSGLTPSQALHMLSTQVAVAGANFTAGLSVAFGSENPAPSNLTATGFEVAVGPVPVGPVIVTVTLPNGESTDASFSFTGAIHTVATNGAGDGFGLALGAPARFVVGGIDEYQTDVDGDFQLEATRAFPSSDEVALAFDASGALAGLRCSPQTSPCTVEIALDGDADFELTDELPTTIETLGDVSGKLVASDLVFDSSGGAVAAYKKTVPALGRVATVAHDRDGDGLFTGPNERVSVEIATGVSSLGAVAVDAAGRVAYLFVSNPTPLADLRLAFDRTGDGDFGDVVDGNPELANVASSPSALSCLGVGFAPDGDVALVYGTGTGVVFGRDQNQDGDFADAGENTTLYAGSYQGCDLSRGGGPLAATFLASPDQLQLLVDRNDDGDFADPGESGVVAIVAGNVLQLAAAHDPSGTAFVATLEEGSGGSVFQDVLGP